MREQKYMKLAIELAEKGCGFVAPNPMVGAVIVKNGEVIGKGYHHKYGGLHAERDALKNCTQNPNGSVMYVTLEPCCHHGKQPPCVEAIAEAGIKKVVIGSQDPNPLVAGKGIRYLKEQGIEVKTDFLKMECDKLNYVFFYYIQTKLPYVVMKYAMTMDGKIATYTGDSKWITGNYARNQVHKDRHRYTGIMTGIGTILADNPLLTCRMEGGKNPIRIICDSSLRTPLNSQIVRTANKVPTIIATCEENSKRIAEYKKRGCEILVLPSKENRVDLNKLMEMLGEKEIDSILMESGSTLNWSAMQSGMPTANLQISSDMDLPPSGVYVTKIEYKGGTYCGVTNIGTRPTVDNDSEISIETHILNFNQKIYGEQLEIYLFKMLRCISKFEDFSALLEQIRKDCIATQEFFGIKKTYSRLQMDIEKHLTKIDNHAICLSNKEFDVLYMLYSNPDTAFTKEQIFEAVWHEPSVGCCHAVENTVFQIRKKCKVIAENIEFIKTVVGYGYKFSYG